MAAGKSHGSKLKTEGYPKTVRLLKRSAYLQLSKAGARCHKKDFLCIFRKGGGNRSRLGITVTRKVGCAARRNRIKRLCREYFRRNRNRLGGIWDLNIIARHSAAVASREQALIQLNEIFESIAENQTSER